jgi:RNA polymerase sigma factor (sigma-70 family)
MALPTVTTDKQALRTPAGFDTAYRAHSRSILIFLARRTYDPETALDLTAETFARAFEARRRFRGATDDEVAAWLFGIARHVLSRYLRRGKAERRALTRLGVEVPSLEPDDLVRIVELAGLDELRGAVARELGSLSQEHREALRLRVVEELSYDDVAQRLSITEPAARARVSRGLRTIGRALDPPATIREKLA